MPEKTIPIIGKSLILSKRMKKAVEKSEPFDDIVTGWFDSEDMRF
jgi:hypothetical protein